MPDIEEASVGAILIEARHLRVTAENLATRLRIATVWRRLQLLVIAVLVVVVGVLCIVVAVIRGESDRTDAKVLKEQQENCLFWYNLAGLQAPTLTKTGFGLIAEARRSYVSALCEPLYGPLPPPIRELKPYLDRKRGPR